MKKYYLLFLSALILVTSGCMGNDELELNSDGTYTAKNYHELKVLVNNVKIPLDKIDTSQITNMSELFMDSKRVVFTGISSWDTSKVKDMSRMFQNAKYFNEDISSWDVSKVKDMSSMFRSAIYFNQDISSWDTSNVKNMSEMFIFATRFNQDISSWNVSKVKDMNYMFYEAFDFNQDISSWNVSDKTNTKKMFFNKNISEYKPINFQEYVSIMKMKNKTNSVNKQEENTEIKNAIEEESTEKSTEESIKESIKESTPLKADISSIHYENSNFYPKHRDELKLLIDNENIHLGNIIVDPIKDMSELFKGSRRKNYEGIKYWNVSNVENMQYMFAESTFNEDISSWNVSNVKNMSGMFENALYFNQDISSWDVSNVYNISDMFKGAFKFNQDISSWNVYKVRYFGSMFYGAESFNKDLSKWKINNEVKIYNTMFLGSQIEGREPSWYKERVIKDE